MKNILDKLNSNIEDATMFMAANKLKTMAIGAAIGAGSLYSMANGANIDSATLIGMSSMLISGLPSMGKLDKDKMIEKGYKEESLLRINKKTKDTDLDDLSM